MAKLFENSGDPDQTTHSEVYDLDMHSLLIILLRLSRLQWVLIKFLAVRNTKAKSHYSGHLSS